MPAKVLDSFALIAYFRDEPGAETMEGLLVSAGKKDSPLLMTDVNYAEVKYSIVKKDGAEAWAEAAKVLQGLPIDFHSTTRALADTAADFKARFKLSLADAFAAALAKERRAELVTGDPEFRPLEKEIKVHWLRLLMILSSRGRAHTRMLRRLDQLRQRGRLVDLTVPVVPLLVCF
jgi:predicted nucleic acid-binding protein